MVVDAEVQKPFLEDEVVPEGDSPLLPLPLPSFVPVNLLKSLLFSP